MFNSATYMSLINSIANNISVRISNGLNTLLRSKRSVVEYMRTDVRKRIANYNEIVAEDSG